MSITSKTEFTESQKVRTGRKRSPSATHPLDEKTEVHTVWISHPRSYSDQVKNPILLSLLLEEFHP